ncbi:MAG: hypothetical protein P8M22_08245 [Phycisphaerales bacterium]|nr:hypothetical protein [Phycisphaerales bacterium]
MKFLAYLTFLLLLVFCMVGAGCGSIVASSDIRQSRIRLNDAIQYTTEKQILLALVQTRFVHGPSYLNISGINSQLKWDAGISGSWMSEGASGVTPSVSYSEQPTITYVPLTGNQYVTQIMAPIRLKTLLLFLSAGWTVGDVFNVVVQRIGPESNGLLSNPQATGQHSLNVTKFRRIMSILTALQLEDKLALSTLAGNQWPTTKWSLEGNKVTEYQFQSSSQMPLALNLSKSLMEPSDSDHEAFMELLSILQVKPDSLESSNDMYPDRVTLLLSSSAFPVPIPSLKIQTRSFHQMLWYLSFAVDVPPMYEDKGWVYVLQNNDGSTQDLDEVYSGILDVKYSRDRPQDSAIEIEYEGYWYYISKDDLASKTTFVLLGQMVQMQAAPTNSMPDLTISAG